MSDQWVQRAPVTGIVAVVLFVIAFAISGETPDFDATSREVLDFYQDNEGAQFASSILAAYGSLFLIFFAGTLRSFLRRGELGEGIGTGTLPSLVLAGGLLQALGILLFSGINFTLADLANSDNVDVIDPGALQTLNALNGDFFFPVAVGTAAFLLASGAAILRSGAMPSWLGWAAVVIGVLGVTPIGFFAFLVSGLWILVAAGFMLQATWPGTTGPGVAPGAAAAPPPGEAPRPPGT